MKQWLQGKIKNWVSLEPSVSKLSWSVLMGNFMAFSPYLGLQTWLCLLLSWVFSLNAKVSLATLYIVSNPWTMIPIIGLDYIVGYWVTYSLLGIDLAPYNPHWMSWLNNKVKPYLQRFLGLDEITLWYYIIGGHVVAITITIVAYPLVKRAFYRFLQAHKYENS